MRPNKNSSIITPSAGEGTEPLSACVLIWKMGGMQGSKWRERHTKPLTGWGGGLGALLMLVSHKPALLV